MNILKHPSEFPKNHQRPVVTVGTFDGVHCGHQQIISEALAEAERLQCPCIVYTFVPHPRLILAPSSPSFLLTSDHEKLGLIEKLNIDYLITQSFTREFSTLEPDRFIADIIMQHLNPQLIVTGFSHVFGKSGKGTIKELQEFGKKYGFQTRIIEPVTQADTKINSTTIRNELLAGKVDTASRMLGRKYSLSGIVVKGEGRGRTIDVPTANLQVENPHSLIPGEGIYAGHAVRGDTTLPCLIYIGSKPTFHKHNIQFIEIHILDFHDDLYGERLKIDFLAKLREEMSFDSVEDLKRQITLDIKSSLAYF